MNKNLTIDQNLMRILYYRYKEYLLPVLILAVCLLIILKVIIPQLDSLFIIKTDEKNASDRVGTLQKNYDYLFSLNDTDIDSELKTVSSALPVEQDFTSIINAISLSSRDSKVAVGDFDFQVGEISSKSARLDSSKAFITINLSMGGDMEAVKLFLDELSKKLPLSEVVSAEISNNGSSFKLSFFYKPFASVPFNAEIPIKTRSNEDKILLQELSLWQLTTSPDLVNVSPAPSASASGF